jgi:hypothetical protein
MTTHDIGKTHDEMNALGMSLGVTWKGCHYTVENGQLSTAMEQAVNELGTGDMRAVFLRARTIAADAAQAAESARLAEKRQRVVALRAVIATSPGHGQETINEVIAAGIPAEAWSEADLKRLSYGVRYFNCGFDSSITPEAAQVWYAQASLLAGVADMLEQESATRPATAPASHSRVQLWEPCEKCGTEPSYQTARGHLCANCC